MDFVLLEFGTDEQGLNNYDGNYLFNKNKNQKHEIFGGYLFDLNKEFVKNYLISSMNYFIEEFRVDGFRLDGLNEIIFNNSPFAEILKTEVDNLNYIIDNLFDCILIAENITSLDYDAIDLHKISFIENSNYMYQVDYLFTKEENQMFNSKEYLEIQKHNDRFTKNNKLIASINHDLFLTGTTIVKDVKKSISYGNKLLKQKLKLSMIYAAPGIKMLFKNIDIGFEETDINDFFDYFTYIYDKNIIKDYVEFKLIRNENTIKYEYIYKNRKLSFLFNLTEETIDINANAVLFYSNGTYENKLDKYSFILFVE
jgi:1,4-alpha-glucan branching enzyme